MYYSIDMHNKFRIEFNRQIFIWRMTYISSLLECSPDNFNSPLSPYIMLYIMMYRSWEITNQYHFVRIETNTNRLQCVHFNTWFRILLQNLWKMKLKITTVAEVNNYIWKLIRHFTFRELSRISFLSKSSKGTLHPYLELSIYQITTEK